MREMEFILRDFLILLILTPWTVDGAGKVVVIYLYNTIYFICIILFNFIANITIAPSPVTAFLYQPAHFTCDGIGDVLIWSVGGNELTDSNNQDREISVTTNNISVDVWSSVLTIRALPINDGIRIQCTVISFNPYGFKAKASTLTVKGNYILTCHFFITNFSKQMLYQ